MKVIDRYDARNALFYFLFDTAPARVMLDWTKTVVMLRLSPSVKVTIWRGADKVRADNGEATPTERQMK